MKITYCTECGKKIEYTTSKPKKCTSCKDVKARAEKFKKTNTNPRSQWKQELNVLNIITNTIINIDWISNGYYSFLPSPKGYSMQLDWYCPEFRFAVEYDGAQHKSKSKWFKQTKKDFEYLQTCDKLKEELCKKNHITLIRIDSKEKPSKELLLEKIRKQNPELLKLLIDNKKITGVAK